MVKKKERKLLYLYQVTQQKCDKAVGKQVLITEDKNKRSIRHRLSTNGW